MKKILLLVQEAIKLFLFFIIAYIWLAFYIKPKAFALILSISIALFFEIVTLLSSMKKNKQAALKLSEQKQAEDMFISLIYDTNSLAFFKQLFETRHKQVKQQKNAILISNNDTTTLFIPFLHLKKLSPDDLLSITRNQANINHLVIYCNDYEKGIDSMLPYFPFTVILLNKYEGYTKLFKEYDYFPIISTSTEIKKTHFKDFLSDCFSKQKTRSYLMSGFFLMLFSIYSPWSIYYKVVASILFCFATICLTRKHSISTKKELV